MRQLLDANRQVERNLSKDIPRGKCILIGMSFLFGIFLAPIKKIVDKRAKCIFLN
jgi:hypothetical protein